MLHVVELLETLETLEALEALETLEALEALVTLETVFADERNCRDLASDHKLKNRDNLARLTPYN